MSTIAVFSCDLCSTEFRPGAYWADNERGGVFTVCRDGTNGSRKWEHLCPGCRRALVSAVDAVVASFRRPPTREGAER